ncbi:MAG TPA: hypothetical protein GXX74_02205 [Clostridiales bacterium]|nr:hypothetical protein [Clostridiales bacterium]
MKFNHKPFDWNRLFEDLKFALTDRSGGWNVPPSPPVHAKKRPLTGK